MLSQFVGIVLLIAPFGFGQRPPAMAAKPSVANQEASVVIGVDVVHENGVPAVEILSTLPSVPLIQFIDSPPRLVIDLLHANISPKLKPIPVHEANILGVRAEQHQVDPPIVRVVVDLSAPYSYTWDEAGNRLMVRLKPPEVAPVKKTRPQRSASLGGASAVVVPVNAASGDVLLAGNRIIPGSSLTTAADTAILQLARGGEVRLCPRTTVSVTPSKNARDLMLGLSTGAVEMHYTLKASSDTVLTPDFRIMFVGPGEFDFAVSTDAHGNTCVRGLNGNTSSAIVSELIGDRIYQVRANDQVVFRAGQIDRVDRSVPLECGCPPTPAVMEAEAAAPANPTLPTGKVTVGESEKRTDAEAPPPPSQPNDVHVQIDAPLVFRGKNTLAALEQEAAALPVIEVTAHPPHLEIEVQPPPAVPESRSQPVSASAPRRLLRRIRGLFSAIFP